MRTLAQPDHELFRILLYRHHASELLVETTSEGLLLPTIPIPRHTRVAEHLTKTIKDKWSLSTCCLFPVDESRSACVSIPFHVVELCGPEVDAPAAMRWLPAASVSAAEFREHDDFAGIQTSLALLDEYRRGERSGAFGKPGWLRTAIEWVEPLAASAGLSLTGEFRQFNASATFSLLRLETDRPALWFKAVGEPNVREFSITRALTTLFPPFIPHVLGWRPDWNAWVSIEAEGIHPGDTTPLDKWQCIAVSLADLQIASCGSGLHLIAAGCRDIRICSLLPLVAPFFECMAELMAAQTKLEPPPLATTEIHSLAKDIRSSLQELNACEIPNTLGHLDFNPGNILVSPGRCVFLDWSEGSVGHPFFTFQYLLEHWRRLYGTKLDCEKTLVNLYTLAWKAFVSADEIAKSLALVPLLAAFAYGASLARKNPDARHRPLVAGYLRSLTRRMKREADALHERRVACVR